MKNLFRSIQLRRAARRFAGNLGPQLRRDYGAGQQYTAQQIRTAAGKLGLPERYMPVGYAAFMSEDAFQRHVGPESAGTYSTLRAMFFRHVRGKPRWGGNPEDSLDIGWSNASSGSGADASPD